MIGKGLFHTHIVVSNLEKSLKFYTGLFGMEKIDFEDGTLVFLTTPGRDDLLALNPGGRWGYPGGCAKENPREEGLAGVQGGMAHFGYMLPSLEDYERAIANVTEFGGRLVVRCEHGRGQPHLSRRSRWVCRRDPIWTLSSCSDIEHPEHFFIRPAGR